MIIDCPNCNFEQPFESEFCPNCGKRIKPLLEQQKKRKTKQGKKTRLILLAFSSLLFIGYVGFFYIQSYTKAQQSKLEPQLSRLEKINLRPRRFTVKKDMVPKSLKIATLKNSEPSETPVENKKVKNEAATPSPTPSLTSAVEYQETPKTRELESIVLIDLYDCELTQPAPTLMTSEEMSNFTSCGQILIEDMPLSGEPFLIEETRDHRIVGQINKSANLVQFDLTLKLTEEEDYNFQSSYSFKTKEPSNTGLSYKFRPFKIKEEVFNALSNSAFTPVLFASGDKPSLKGDFTYLYIFLIFK